MTQKYNELIKESEGLLIRSGYLAKARTEKRNDYINKGIKYELMIGRELVRQIQVELPDKWAQWVAQTHDYLVHGKDKNKRPTIDRRNSDGNYCLENIDFLPFYQHIQKDKAIAITVYDMQGMSFKQYVTMTEASKALMCSVETISKYTGSGVLYKSRYLVQSEGEKVGKSNNKVEREQRWKAVFNVIMNKFDEDGNVIHTFPAQIESEISFPMIEARRQMVL